MLINIVRCKHCGNHYNLQVSGEGFKEFNSDRSEDYCPECYAIIKSELNTLEDKLHCKEMRERYQRYKHAYVKANDITIEDVLNFCIMNYSNTEVYYIDDWGYKCYPYTYNHVYVRGDDVYRKFLIDSKENKVISKDCARPHRYRDSINQCTTYNYEL